MFIAVLTAIQQHCSYMKILLFLLLPILGVSQNLHAGLKDAPDMKQYSKEITCYKYSVKSQTMTECKAYIFSNGIVIRKGNTILEFTTVYPRVYRDSKGKLVEMSEDKDYYYLRATAQTIYCIKK